MHLSRNLFALVFLIIISVYVEAAAGTNSDVADAAGRYSQDLRIMHRTFDLPYSENSVEKWDAFFKLWDKELSKIRFSELNTDGRIDLVLLKNRIKFDKERIERDRIRDDSVLDLLPFAGKIVAVEENRRSRQRIPAREYAELLFSLDKEVRKVIDRVKVEELDMQEGKSAAGMTARLRRILKKWYSFYNGYDPLFTWWIEKPYEELDKSLGDLQSLLESKYVHAGRGPVVIDPIGEDVLLKELKNSMIDYTPAELIETGWKEYRWCETEMIKASNELGFGDDWRKALEHVKTLHVEPGEQPYMIQGLADEAIEFLKKHDLITIPWLAENTWKMSMMSPARQLVNPFFLGGETIQVSYPTNTMSHADKLMSMRGNNPHFSKATVHHELIAGHHLQGFMTSRYRSYRRLFNTPFWLEGWALHWEMLLWDMGFPGSPENRIGFLFWRMHRCARIVFSLSYHMNIMSYDECVELLVDGVGHEPANAAAEVRRSFEGNYPPLYQCAYLLGGLQVRSLFKEVTEKGIMTPKDFHDAFLRENSIPIKLMRIKFLGIELKERNIADWKFLDR